MAFFEALPLAVIQPCIAIAKHAMQDLRKDHKKLLRLLYYLIHVLLGCGRAGTTGPKDPDDTVSASILPPHILKDYWEMFAQPTKDVAQLVANLHVLAGILRAIRLCPSQNKQKSNQGEKENRTAFFGKQNFRKGDVHWKICGIDQRRVVFGISGAAFRSKIDLQTDDPTRHGRRRGKSVDSKSSIGRFARLHSFQRSKV